MPFGCALERTGGARFRLWAPSSAAATLELTLPNSDEPMRYAMRKLDGWHEIEVPQACEDASYRYVVETLESGALAVPDPASRSNPQGVHGASRIVDPRGYAWCSSEWRGRSWPDAVVYELHIGTFTPEGTFAAARERLADLKLLGVTALQIMPLAAFPGARNWGYDGVLQFAPAPCYGTPADLKSFIDGAHELGMMVLLDVVYNHFGPEGNYLHAYSPEFFKPAPHPWGAAINFDGAGSRTVRDFFVHNALYWIEEFRFDGLRLDAIHAIRDQSSPHIIAEIAAAIRAGPGLKRQVHLILENNANQARYLERDADGEPRIATAQWDDDVHHALHVLVSGEADGYYADYAGEPLKMLGRSLAEGFAYQGEYSTFRDRGRGEPSAQLPPAAFVTFLQNHDMVGNRAFGERISAFADPRLISAAYACLLLSPQVPMLFMGRSSPPQRRSCTSVISALIWRCRCRMAGGVNSSALPPSRTMPRWRAFQIPMPNRLSATAGCAGRSGSRRRIESGWISSANFWRCGGATWRRTCPGACVQGVLRSSTACCAWNGDWRTAGRGLGWRTSAIMPYMPRCPNRERGCSLWAVSRPRHRKPAGNRER